MKTYSEMNVEEVEAYEHFVENVAEDVYAEHFGNVPNVLSIDQFMNSRVVDRFFWIWWSKVSQAESEADAELGRLIG